MPDSPPPDELTARLDRLERKVTILLWLTGIVLAMPLVQYGFGLVKWSAVVIVVLIVVAIVLALFRDKMPQLLRRGGRWAVDRALAEPEPKETSTG